MFYTPMLGALSDRATLTTLGWYEWQLRSIVFSGTLGAILGTLAIPTFVMLYLRAIRSLERSGNVPKAALGILRPATIAAVLSEIKFGIATRVQDLPFRRIPKDILVLNVLVTSVYGIGIVAAAYASVLYPQGARTAVLSSGLVNGFATIAYNVVVDPTSALITDRAVRGERSIQDVQALVAGLSVTAVIGLVLSQLLLVPGATLIEYGAKLITGH